MTLARLCVLVVLGLSASCSVARAGPTPSGNLFGAFNDNHVTEFGSINTETGGIYFGFNVSDTYPTTEYVSTMDVSSSTFYTSMYDTATRKVSLYGVDVRPRGGGAVHQTLFTASREMSGNWGLQWDSRRGKLLAGWYGVGSLSSGTVDLSTGLSTITATVKVDEQCSVVTSHAFNAEEGELIITTMCRSYSNQHSLLFRQNPYSGHTSNGVVIPGSWRPIATRYDPHTKQYYAISSLWNGTFGPSSAPYAYYGVLSAEGSFHPKALLPNMYTFQPTSPTAIDLQDRYFFVSATVSNGSFGGFNAVLTIDLDSGDLLASTYENGAGTNPGFPWGMEYLPSSN